MGCPGLCDTLRTDDDTGDECVACGAVYSDPARRHVYIARQVAHTVRELPTPGQVSAPRATRGVAYHSFNFGATGGKGLAFRAGKR